MLAAYPNVYLRRITLHLKDAFRYIKFRIYKTIVLIGQSSALPTVIRLSKQFTEVLKISATDHALHGGL